MEGLWILYFAHLSLGSVRHVPLFVAVTAPVIAIQVSRLVPRMDGEGSQKSRSLELSTRSRRTRRRLLNAYSVWPAATGGRAQC